eukprot:EST45554.1 Transmembrane domain-containing protein [Spironucleus salmonicida]
MQRAIPSNYAVLARNIPSELFNTIFENFEDITQIIPCLENKQQKLYENTQELIKKIKKLTLKQQKFHAYYICLQKPSIKYSIPFINKLHYYYLTLRQQYNLFKIQSISQQIQKFQIKKHFTYNELVPFLPSIKKANQNFSIGETLNLKTYFNVQQSPPNYYQQIYDRKGLNAFIICDSQVSAAQKISLLLTADRKKPEIIPAPYYADIQWRKLSRSISIIKLSSILTFITILISFLIFFGLQSLTIQFVNNNGLLIINFIQTDICFNEPNCYALANFLITYVFGLIPTIFASLLPIIIDFAVKPANTVSNTHLTALKYKILFIFLILLNGILQVAFPAALNPETGQFDLSFLTTANISDIINNIGQNIPLQIFSFLTFLITKYLNEGPGNIVGVGDFLMYIIGLVLPSIKKAKWYQKNDFDYYIALAGKLHMFTIAMMYMVIAPISFNVLIIIEFMNQFCERYQILYKSKMVPTNEMSPGIDIIKMVMDDIYFSSIYLLFCTVSYCLTTKNVILKYSSVFLALVGFYLIFKKISFNSSYKESSQQLATGACQQSDQNIVQLPVSYIHSDIYQELQSQIMNEDIIGKSVVVKGSYDANQIALCYCHPACFLDID